MPSWIIGPAGQPIDVSEWITFTFGPSISRLVEEADLDDVHAELGILDPVQRLDDVVLGDHEPSLPAVRREAPAGARPGAVEPRCVRRATSRSAPVSTRSSICPIASSSVVFSITGTSKRRARSSRTSWIMRISVSPSRYFSSGRRPSVAASRTQKWLRCASSSLIATTHWTTSASARSTEIIPGTMCTPSSTIDQPSVSDRSIAASTPTSTFRVWSRKPSSAASPADVLVGVASARARPRSSSSAPTA